MFLLDMEFWSLGRGADIAVGVRIADLRVAAVTVGMAWLVLNIAKGLMGFVIPAVVPAMRLARPEWTARTGTSRSCR